MVAIASVVAMDTQVVIFDEPTIAQDYPGKEKIKQLIRQLSENGQMVRHRKYSQDLMFWKKPDWSCLMYQRCAKAWDFHRFS